LPRPFGQAASAALEVAANNAVAVIIDLNMSVSSLLLGVGMFSPH
jgi:hypothetical protein